MANVVVDPFHRALKRHLDEMIEKVVDELSNGSAMGQIGDPVTTGEKYAAQVGQVKTLRVVLALCDLVADEVTRPAKVNIEER